MLPESVLPIVLGGFPVWMVVFTALWAREPRRRADARRVLAIVLRFRQA